MKCLHFAFNNSPRLDCQNYFDNMEFCVSVSIYHVQIMFFVVGVRAIEERREMCLSGMKKKKIFVV